MIRHRKNSGMKFVEKRQSAAFTLMEMLVTIGVIAILAAISVGVISLAKTTSTEKRIEGQLNKLITAIEQYKSKVGFYPPDHQVRSGNGQVQFTPEGRPVVNPVLNPLYYELRGVLVDLNTQSFVAAGDPMEYALTTPQVVSWFGMDGFQNSARDLASIRSTFDGFKPSEIVTVDGSIVGQSPRPTGSARLLSVPASWPRKFQDTNPLGRTDVNVWRYNSSNPTNNPASFDLWAEIPFINESGEYELRVIGNWNVN